MKKIAVGLLGLSLLVSVPALAHNDGPAARSWNGQSTVDPNSAVSIGGPFTMTDETGKQVTDNDFHGRFMLLFFGFTNCPDVCPTEMQVVADALKELGPELAAKIQPVMVSVDPSRDTPAALTEFAAKFDTRIKGFTGTEEQVAAIAKAYRVYYAREADPAPTPGSDNYLMNHSSYFYLMGPDGQFNQVLPSDTAATDMAARLKPFLTQP